MDESERLKRLAADRKAKGQCVRCGKLNPAPERVNCPGCREKMATKMKGDRDSRRDSGVCTVCGQPVLPGRKLCEMHKGIILASNAVRLQKLRDAGMCEHCGKSPAIPCEQVSKLCEICWFKQVSRAHFRNVKRWPELQALFNRQNVCPYTGYALHARIDASLDHKTPKCMGGTNDIGNLQWVYNRQPFDINRMKGDMSDTEFKKVVKLMAEHLNKKR